MYGLEIFKICEIFPSVLSNLQKPARRNFCVDLWQFVQNLYFGSRSSFTNVMCSIGKLALRCSRIVQFNKDQNC